MDDDACNGHGDWDAASETCDCDSLYNEPRCAETFRDATGAAWTVAQVVFFPLYTMLALAALQQLLVVPLDRGQRMRVAILGLVFSACICHLVWLADPFGFQGTVSRAASIFVVHAGNLCLLLASVLTVAHWRRLLSTSRRSSTNNVLEGRFMHSMLVGWLLLAFVSTAVLAHLFIVDETEDGWHNLVLNVLIVVVSFTQTVVLLRAGRGLRQAILPLSSDRSRIAKLDDMVHMWYLAGSNGFVLTVVIGLSAALGLAKDPWWFFLVRLVVMRLCLFVSLLVYFSATAVFTVPWVHALLRLILRIFCLWKPSSQRRPRTSGRSNSGGGNNNATAPLPLPLIVASSLPPTVPLQQEEPPEVALRAAQGTSAAEVTEDDLQGPRTEQLPTATPEG